MGMAFVDAMVDHADVRVALVDRRHGVGGHWLEAYPFVRLHQASAFYGVASTLLGGGRLQQHGPEEGLHERATVAEICLYYARMLDRMLDSGKVEFFPNSDYLGDRTVLSRISGRQFQVPARCRIVDAHYLAPSIPAEKPAPFIVADHARVVPVNDLVHLEQAPSQYVVVGSGKTATDACIWLLARGVDPNAICWVRPREPWMINRAVVQPEPAIFLGMVADTMQAALEATSLDDLFVRLEDTGIMLRIDRTVLPAMAKTPTLAMWDSSSCAASRTSYDEVTSRPWSGQAHLRQRLGRGSGRARCRGGALRSGRPEVPPACSIWRPEVITLQPIRAGFPCFGAALAGYVEATRRDDTEKNRVCPPSPYGDSMAGWARMTVLGTRAAMSFSAEPDIKQWADGVALNPARIPPGTADQQLWTMRWSACERTRILRWPGLLS